MSYANVSHSVDTCTDLLPSSKPRYVMGVVCIHFERIWSDNG